jgi:DNA-binding GntR family transcriptional regulator
LLEVSQGAPLMRVEGKGFGSDGEPVRRTISIYRGDRFRFAVAGSGSPLDIELLPAQS